MDPLLPPDRRIRLAPRRPTRRRRLLQIMLGGSLLVHVLALLAVWLLRPETPPDQENNASNEVAMVFESPGATQPSSSSPSATKASAQATGNVNATQTQTNPDTSAPAPPQPPTPTPPPPPPPPAPEPPTPPTQTPPDPAPPPTPETPPQPPQPEQPPAPDQPPQTQAPHPPATVSLNSDEAPALTIPDFVPPQPPPPLPPPPLPRPRVAPPRQYARPSPQNPFASPQNWSFNAAPSSQPQGRASRGFDLSTGDFSGQKDATLGYVAGAHPTGDWLGALRRWATARLYYPEQAIADHQQGTAVVLLTIARSGQVLDVKLLQSARSPFLDGAWIDVFRGSTVPAFTPDMAENTTQITYTLHYRLTEHGG